MFSLAEEKTKDDFVRGGKDKIVAKLLQSQCLAGNQSYTIPGHLGALCRWQKSILHDYVNFITFTPQKWKKKMAKQCICHWVHRGRGWAGLLKMVAVFKNVGPSSFSLLSHLAKATTWAVTREALSWRLSSGSSSPVSLHTTKSLKSDVAIFLH